MTAKTTSPSANRAGTKATHDAITLLTNDHKEVKKLFKEFEKLSDSDDISAKEELVEQICQELTIHTEIEEEIFYPATREAIKDDDLLNEAEVEHASAKDLIAQLQSMDSSDDMYDAKVTVLGEYIEHHVQEEESEMFPKARKSKMDLVELGEKMSERKEELLAASPNGQVSRTAPKTKGKVSAKSVA